MVMPDCVRSGLVSRSSTRSGFKPPWSAEQPAETKHLLLAYDHHCCVDQADSPESPHLIADHLGLDADLPRNHPKIVTVE
jgi:hypothetical protein